MKPLEYHQYCEIITWINNYFHSVHRSKSKERSVTPRFMEVDLQNFTLSFAEKFCDGNTVPVIMLNQYMIEVEKKCIKLELKNNNKTL